MLRKRYFIFLAIGLCIGVIIFAVLSRKDVTLQKVIGCIANKEFLANEPEMKNVFPEGTVYKFLEGYQKCNTLRRGDILVVEKPSENAPSEVILLPRVLRASPGDLVEVFPSPVHKGFSLKINGEMLYDLDGKKPHLFSPGQWDLKEGRVHGLFKKGSFTLGPDEYLVFSSLSPSFNDSSSWGPVRGQQIKGRAVKKE